MSDDEPVGVIRIGRPPAMPPQRPPMRPKRPNYRRYALLGGLGVLVLAVGAATAGIAVARHDAAAATTPTPPAATASRTPQAAVVDADGKEACRLVKAAYDDDQLMDRATVTAIMQAAASSSNQSLRFDAQMLHDRQALAIAGDKPSYVLNLQTAAIEMQTDCTRAGLY